MVVLVRCNDETCSVALETCLDDLTKGGLISAYLQDGKWVPVPAVRPLHHARPVARKMVLRAMA